MSKTRKHRFFVYLLLEVCRTTVMVLPRSMARALLGGAAFLAFHLLRKDRAKTLRNLRVAFGERYSDDELKRLGAGVFVHLGKNVADVLQFPKLSSEKLDQLVVVDDDEMGVVDRVLEERKGFIGLGAHMGNWELSAVVCAAHWQLGGVVARKIYYEPFNQVLVALRKSAGVETIYREQSMRTVLSKLRGNQWIGILADQDVEHLEGIYVSFFGKPAWTPTAPAKLSLASGAPIVPLFLVHEAERYRLYLGDPIWPERGKPREIAIRDMTEAWSSVVERTVRQFPDQWVWMHNRWKTTPEVLERRPVPRQQRDGQMKIESRTRHRHHPPMNIYRKMMTVPTSK